MGAQSLNHDIDYNTEHGAKIIANRIVSYWAARGVKVNLTVVPSESGGCSVIRSNIGMYVPKGEQWKFR